MSAQSDWLQRIMFAAINSGSLICCKLLQIEVTLELYVSPFFHKGKNMEELTTNTEVSKVSLKIIIISGTRLSTFYTAEFNIDHEK